MQVSVRAASAILGLMCCSVALAWGTEGHQVIAILAESRLSPTASSLIYSISAEGESAVLHH